MLLPALVLALAACAGPAAGGPAGDDGAPTVEEVRKAQLAWAACMREHDVDVPDPQVDDQGRVTMRGPGGPGAAAPDRAVVEAAEKACEQHREDVEPQLSEEDREELKTAALAHARCMREHGIDFPDPQFDDSGRVTQRLRRGEVDPDSAAFRAAEKACSAHMPAPGSPGGAA